MEIVCLGRRAMVHMIPKALNNKTLYHYRLPRHPQASSSLFNAFFFSTTSHGAHDGSNDRSVMKEAMLEAKQEAVSASEDSVREGTIKATEMADSTPVNADSTIAQPSAPDHTTWKSADQKTTQIIEDDNETDHDRTEKSLREGDKYVEDLRKHDGGYDLRDD